MDFHFRRKPPISYLLLKLKPPLIISLFSTKPFYPITFSPYIFQECSKKKALQPGRQAHAQMIVSGFKPTVIDSTCLLQMYIKCSHLECASKVFDTMPVRTCVSWTAMMSGYSADGKMRSAQSLFDLMPERNLISWSSLISGYLKNGNCLKSIELFVMMGRDVVAYDGTTFAVVLKACASLEDYATGLQIHGAVVKSGFEYSVMAGLMRMYANCKMLNESLRVYIGMLRLGMEPDEFIYSTVLKACAGGEALQRGREIHGRVIKCGMGSNSVVSSSMIGMYCKCRVLEDAEKHHERMKEQTLVSWNAMISGYSSTEGSLAAQKHFLRMLGRGITPDGITFLILLNTCSEVANAGLGKQIHAQIIKQSMQSHVHVINTLVDMYSKCGNIQDSILMFRKSSNRDVVTWTSMVCAYAHHGYANEALQTFEKMVLEKVMPNHTTFVGVLHACAHSGLVDEALHYLCIMQKDYGLSPQLKHYSCVVDALGRCGRIDDALKLIDDMPWKANFVIWMSLLSNCKMHGNVKVAEIAARALLQLNPQDHRAYLLLSQVYKDAGMWDEASKMRRTMKSSGLKKDQPGCSWIEVYSLLMFS